MKKVILFIIGLTFLASCRSQALTTEVPGILDLINDQNFVYLQSTQRPTELFLFSQSKRNSTQLTTSAGKIFDYDILQGRKGVLYSVINDLNGADIWYLDFKTLVTNLLVDCGVDTCSSPRSSPTGEIFSYLRGSFSSDQPNFEKNTVIRLFNLSQLEEISLEKAVTLSGSTVLWSPDGDKFAYYSFKPAGIRIIDTHGNEMLTMSGTPVTSGFGWGRDSDYFYFLMDEISDDLPITILEQVYIPEKRFQRLSIELAEDEVINGLKVSAQNGLFLLNVRTSSVLPGQKMVIYDSKKQTIIAETDDPNVSYGNISWSADGHSVLFQRYAFNQTSARPEVGIWNYSDNKLEIYATDAFMPKWLY